MRSDPAPALAAPPYAERPITFGPFVLLPASGVLLEGGRPVRLGTRALGLLTGLVSRAGEVVTKQELIALAWPGEDAEEATLRVHIGALRKVLGDGQGGVRYIANVAGRGYCFVGAVGAPAEPPAPVERTGPRRLPARLTRVVGREDIVTALVDTVPARRLVTLCGAGGMGKTTVAVAAAERLLPRYADGVHFVDLGTVGDPTLVPDAVAAAVDFAPPVGGAPGALIAHLRTRRLLLVLDGCEHSLEAVAALAVALRHSAPGVDLLATSREPLQCDGEWIQRLPSLAFPPRDPDLSAQAALQFPAVQLFVERVIASLDTFQFADRDVACVAELCARLDGMPLALELAAAQVDAYGLRGLVRLLDDRFRVLSHGLRNMLPRHRTLDALLDWSHDSLSPHEQCTLARLAVFRGEFTLDWAQAIAGFDAAPAWTLVDAIESLAAKSLLTVDAGGDVVRYRLLDTTRVYALDKLRERGELDPVRRVHAEHWCALFKVAAQETVGPSRAEWVDAHGRTLNDVRAALDWALAPGGDRHLAATLTLASHPLAHYLGLADEWRRHMERCLRAGVLDIAVEQRLECWRGALLWQTQGDVPTLREAFARAIAIGEMAATPSLMVDGWKSRWMLAFACGNQAVARDAAMRVMQVASGDAFARIWGERAYAEASHFAGDHAPVAEVATRVLRVREPFEQRRQHGTVMLDRRVSMGHLHARACWIEGRADEAENVLATVMPLAEDDLPHSLCHVLAFTACPMALWNGDLTLADTRIRRLVDHAERHALGFWASWGRNLRSLLAWRRGEVVDLGVLRAAVAMRGVLQAELFATLAIDFADDAITSRAADARAGWCAPELLRARALRPWADPHRRRTALYDAMALARRQGALAWELRAGVSLAHAWREAGEPERGMDLLADVCGRFREGSDTADWRAAQALLVRPVAEDMLT